jgi:hypothetical protein
LNEAIRQAETPSPISARATASSVSESANGEQRTAGGGDQQQRGFDPARAVAVQGEAERQLHGAEGEQVGAGQEAEVGGRDAEFARQFRRDHGIDVAQEVGKVIARGEGQEDAQPEVHRASP